MAGSLQWYLVTCRCLPQASPLQQRRAPRLRNQALILGEGLKPIIFSSSTTIGSRSAAAHLENLIRYESLESRDTCMPKGEVSHITALPR